MLFSFQLFNTQNCGFFILYIFVIMGYTRLDQAVAYLGSRKGEAGGAKGRPGGQGEAGGPSSVIH